MLSETMPLTTLSEKEIDMATEDLTTLSPSCPFGYGKCSCGCGATTGIPRYTNLARGMIAGQPRRFVPGHNKYTLGDITGKTFGRWLVVARVPQPQDRKHVAVYWFCRC